MINDNYIKQITQQCIGFVHTPNLLENKVLIPFSNEDISPIDAQSITFSPQESAELNKQKYLGKRVEVFFKKWLDLKSNINLIAHGLQVIDHKTTIGEFDFLYRLQENYVHTELVYKQYIFIPNIGKDDLGSWVGPNKKDFLHLKLKKLQHKQFPLLYNKLSIDLMKSKFSLNASSFQQKICFKAQLYLHFTESHRNFFGINPHAIIGKWYYFKEFRQQDFDNYSFLCIDKQNWPVLPTLDTEEEWSCFSTIIANIKPSIQDKRSVKLWQKTEQEIHQLFVIWE